MNLKHIMSNTSIQLSSNKSKTREQSSIEKTKLLGEIELLQENVKYLNNCLKDRDTTIKTLSGEKEKLFVDLKSVQRINRNLRQQINDEREINFKEKEYLIQEILKYTKHHSFTNKDITVDIQRPCSDKKPQDNDLEMVQQFNIKDEVIYNIASKYMKMSYTKKCLQRSMCLLHFQIQKMCENIISLLQDNRNTMDKIIKAILMYSKKSTSSRKYFNDIKSYGHLHYENMQLKMFLLSYKANVIFREAKSKKCNQSNPDCSKNTNKNE